MQTTVLNIKIVFTKLTSKNKKRKTLQNSIRLWLAETVLFSGK